MPTVIDSLIVKLGLDTKDLSSGSASAGKQIKDLEGSTKKLSESSKSASTSVDSLAKSVGSFLAVLGGTYALRAFIEDTIASNAALDRLSKNLGLSVEDISAWGNAVEELGGNAKGLQGTMQMLSQSQTELRFTGQSALLPYFASLGIAIADINGKTRPVNELLLDLAERFSHMDRTQANNLGKMMGIDQDTLNLLLQGRREVELTIKRQKEFNAVSKAQAEESAKLQKSLVNLRQSFVAMGRDLLQQASPALEKVLGMLTSFAAWIQNNREFIKDFGIILGVIAAGFTAISIAASPITLTVAAVLALAAAVALLWQDYETWKRGGDSLIDWEKWKPGIDAAKAAILDLAGVVKESFRAISGAVGQAQKLLNGDWRGALKGEHATDDHIVNAVKGVFHAVQHVDQATAVPDQLKPKILGGKRMDSVTSAYAMKYFMDRGMSRAEAAGLASQIHSESNGRIGAVGDSGKAYGLIQWHADRQANFKKLYGHDIREGSADEQLGFIVHELNQGTERGAGNRLKGASSGEQAGEIASKYYVRPRDVQGEATRRGAYAAQLDGIQGATSSVASAGSASAPGKAGGNDHSVSVQTGPITIQTPSNDPAQHAKDFTKALSWQFASQANAGLN